VTAGEVRAPAWAYVLSVLLPVAGLAGAVVYFARNAPSQAAGLLAAAGLGMVLTYLVATSVG